MKKISILLCVVLYFYCNLLSAQRNTSFFQLGLDGAISVPVTNASPLKLGFGQNVHAWAKVSVGENDAIKFGVGYRRLTGFRQKSVRFEEYSYPTEYHRWMTSTQLGGLAYVDADLGWFHQIEGSPWSYAISGYFARLVDVKGREHQSVWAVDQKVRIRETSFSSGWGYSEVVLKRKDLNKAYLQGYDFGLRLQVFYQISPGLQIVAGYYQGLQNIFSESFFLPGKRQYISSLSLGFAARLL